MSYKKINKGNPRWVRQGQGNKIGGDYHWEYAKDGKYYAEGFYKTAQEAYDACVKHQELMDRWRNPEKYAGVITIEE